MGKLRRQSKMRPVTVLRKLVNIVGIEAVEGEAVSV